MTKNNNTDLLYAIDPVTTERVKKEFAHYNHDVMTSKICKLCKLGLCGEDQFEGYNDQYFLRAY